jgi:hypothetical protein
MTTRYTNMFSGVNTKWSNLQMLIKGKNGVLATVDADGHPYCVALEYHRQKKGLRKTAYPANPALQGDLPHGKNQNHRVEKNV